MGATAGFAEGGPIGTDTADPPGCGHTVREFDGSVTPTPSRSNCPDSSVRKRTPSLA
jgi:hypothetical protein